MRIALSLDDVLLVPNYSELSSRQEVDLSTDAGWGTLRLPLISSPMDTVTDAKMIQAMRRAGGDGVHHRYCSVNVLEGVVNRGFPIAVSPSMGIDCVKKMADYTNRLIVIIDVAHGDSKPSLDYAAQCVNLGAVVVSGNVVTWQAVRRYIDIGVNIMRVGVGNGSSCSTRLVAGVGVPQFTALRDIYYAYGNEIKIISDGGVHYSGDIVKALAAGASAVMTGRLFAGCDEAPGMRDVIDGRPVKQYRGMASRESLDEAGKERNIEGVAGWVELSGLVASVMSEVEMGLRAGYAYCGARNIQELHDRAAFIQITHNGNVEGRTRI
jgi:IMP dehydrogenase